MSDVGMRSTCIRERVQDFRIGLVGNWEGMNGPEYCYLFSINTIMRDK